MQLDDLYQLQLSLSQHMQGLPSNISTWIDDKGPLSVDQRLSIYRNAYQIRLKGVLETDHEILGRFLGDDLWHQMLDGYIRCLLYTSPSPRDS